MKCIYCLNCNSIVRLHNKKRLCECWKTGGVYIDNLNAIYFGKNAHPFGIDNSTFWLRIRENFEENLLYNLKYWLEEWSWRFIAFSLLRKLNGCSDTFKKKTKKYFNNLTL